MQPSSSYPVSPPEQRCVWMSAGVLTYQLCARNFDCAQCPIDTAIRNMVREGKHAGFHCLTNQFTPLRQGRYYTQEHCWVSIRSADTVRVGLEPNLVLRLRGMIGVSLPSLQASVPARVPSAWCRFDQGMVPVRLPFALQATGVNPVVGHDPSSVLDDPYESGWLFDARIDRSRLDGAGVMSAWTAEKMYAEDEQQFVEAIRDAGGRSPKPAGRTGYDGGTVSQEALQLLGSAQYCSLIARMYCKAS